MTVTVAPNDVFQQEMLAKYLEISGLPSSREFKEGINHLSKETCLYVSTLLRMRIPELNDPSVQVAVATTGSDGRYEKSNPLSAVELIAITPDKRQLSPELCFTIEKISQLVQEEGSPFYPEIECKQLERDRIITATFKVTKVIPTRGLDAHLLVGNPFLFAQYKQQLYEELKNQPLAKFKKDFVNDAHKTLQGELCPTSAKRALSVEIDSGTLISDGKYKRGPKYGLLRTIQYTIAHTESLLPSHPQLSIESNGSKIIIS
jgi:hypothetical protein